MKRNEDGNLPGGAVALLLYAQLQGLDYADAQQVP